MKKCDCDDWDEYIDAVCAYSLYKQYREHVMIDLKPFEYCPWCGDKLKDDIERLAYAN